MDSLIKETMSPRAEEEWDEVRLQSALERLHEMHVDVCLLPMIYLVAADSVQLRQLRDAIPSIVRPIHAEYNSPEDLYAEFKSAAVEAVGDVRQFRSLMRDSKSGEVMARARQSKSLDGEGIQTWLVDQHAGWLDEPAVRSAKELKAEDELEFPAPVLEPTVPEPPPPVDQIVKAFKERHPDITVNLQEQISNILVRLLYHLQWTID